jgi:cytochrome P450
MMGQLLRLTSDDDLIRRTLGGMLVGAIDTTTTAVAKIMTVLMNDHLLFDAVRRDRGDLGRLNGWCEEALRRWTQTPVLGRRAAYDTNLAGVAVPAGAKIVLWTQAAMFDASAFPYPDVMRPDRDGAIYLHLGAGLHPCAGRAINAWQIVGGPPSEPGDAHHRRAPGSGADRRCRGRA